VLRDLSAPALAAAIEASWIAWWAHYRHAPQADVHNESDLLWLTTGIPIPEFRVVVRTQLDPAAITLAPLLAARAQGYRAGVLLSSPLGLPVYRRLGFERCCAFNLYTWPE
jgi:hypothetical protein